MDTFEFGIDELPVECARVIFGKISAADVGRVASVSKYWRDLIYSDDKLWENLFDCEWRPTSWLACHPQTLRSSASSTNGRALYCNWMAGKPAQTVLNTGAHGDSSPNKQRVSAIKLNTLGRQGTAWSSGEDGRLACWDLGSNTLQGSWTAHEAGIQSLCLVASPDSGPANLACTGGSDGWIRGWDIRQGQKSSPAFEIERAHYDEVSSLLACPDPNFIVSGGGDESGHRWDLRCLGGEALNSYEGHAGHIYDLAIDPATNFLYTASGDKNIHRYELLTGEWRTMLRGHTADVYSLSLGSQRLLSGSEDGTVREWELFDEATAPEEDQLSIATLGMRRDAGEGVTTATHITCIAGLGDGPQGVLVGTWEGALVCAPRFGRIRPFGRSVEKPQGQEGYVPITCLAACGEVVLTGFQDGSLRFMRMVQEEQGEGEEDLTEG